MSKHIEYKSVFAPYFDSFLKMKDTMGYGLTHCSMEKNPCKRQCKDTIQQILHTISVLPLYVPPWS